MKRRVATVRHLFVDRSVHSFSDFDRKVDRGIPRREDVVFAGNVEARSTGVDFSLVMTRGGYCFARRLEDGIPKVKHLLVFPHDEITQPLICCLFTGT